MAILIDETKRVLVQGIAGSEGWVRMMEIASSHGTTLSFASSISTVS